MLNELTATCNLAQFQQVRRELWNEEYEALHFVAGTKKYRSRLAKKTPKKDGYFLTLWEKNAEGTNIPFAAKKFCDYLVVFIVDKDRRAYFYFPREELARRGILTLEGQKGKMAFRVYPSWCTGLNASAKRTQSWQAHFFNIL